MAERLLPRKVFEKPVRQELIRRRIPSTEQLMPETNGDIAKNPYEPAWARWARTVDWKDRLYKQAAHKALDIPDEMGDINAPKTMVSHNGISPWAIVALAALGLYGANMFRQPVQPAPPVQPPAVVDTDTDTSTEIFIPQ